jgi:hypothetical protein
VGRFPHPRVFLAKSAQAAESNQDMRNCELRRVRKRLKTKGRVFGVRGNRDFGGALMRGVCTVLELRMAFHAAF